uniref:DNA sliding clamp PCNA n=1 Tax=Globodera pallida TaxID=36090 RepID=A0A183BWW2_GLOPA
MFEAKFTNAALLKKIVEAIKELVSEAPFDCTENSMCLQAMDGSHVALISLKLDIGIFEVYRCDRTIALGLSLGELSKVLKCSKSDDTLMIRFEDSEQDMVTFTFEDTKGRKQDITLKLMDIDNEHLGIPDQKYAAVVEMPSTEFQKVCRDISSFSDSMNITATKSGVVFSGSGDSVTNTIRYTKDKTADEDDKDRVDITVKEKVALNFSIKYLTNFTKATSLSDRVRLSMCDNVPLVVEYDLESNGYLRYFLAPKIDEDKEGMDE